MNKFIISNRERLAFTITLFRIQKYLFLGQIGDPVKYKSHPTRALETASNYLTFRVHHGQSMDEYWVREFVSNDFSQSLWTMVEKDSPGLREMCFDMCFPRASSRSIPE